MSLKKILQTYAGQIHDKGEAAMITILELQIGSAVKTTPAFAHMTEQTLVGTICSTAADAFEVRTAEGERVWLLKQYVQAAEEGE